MAIATDIQGAIVVFRECNGPTAILLIFWGLLFYVMGPTSFVNYVMELLL